MTAIPPKFKCEAIAREVNRIAKPTRPVSWQDVRNYAAPRLPGLTDPVLVKRDRAEAARIVKALDRELRYQHVWING